MDASSLCRAGVAAGSRGALIAALLLLADPSARAATIRVPGDQPTIQAGLDAAAVGDTVLVAPGTYTGPSNKDMDFGGEDVVLRSEAGAGLTIIDVEGSAPAPARAFYFHSGETAAAAIEGFTIRNGFLTDGMSIQGNGGAVLIVGAAPTFRQCRFENNSVAYLSGGAIYCQDGGLALEGCSFILNAANFGGAVSISGSTLVLDRCAFEQNSARAAGALNVSTCTAAVSHSIFFNNFATVEGGAIDCEYSGAGFDNCTLSHNYVFQGHGGGMLVIGGTVEIRNTIIAFGSSGEALWGDGPAPALSCCDLYGNVGGDWVGFIAGQLGTNGNISEDPVFCLTVPGDLTLHASSPCAPEHSPGDCGLIGALPVGCGVSDVAGQEAPAPKPRLTIVPNPVRSGATFTFDVGIAFPALEIYDANGRLIDLMRPTGQSATWLADKGTPPGVFFARLRWAGGTRVVKFLVVR